MRAQARGATLGMRRAAPGLRIEDFRPLGIGGLGDGANSYPHAMAWFQDCLYVGTTRHMLTLHMRPGKIPAPPKYVWFPVKGRNPMPPEEMRGEILRYDSSSERWELVFRAPMIEVEGEKRMRDIGYRSMTAFRRRGDSEPALYVTTISATGLRLLRCVDGEKFEQVGPTGIVHPEMVSCRSLLPWRERLYFTSAGVRGKHGNETAVPGIFETDDPESARWRLISSPGIAGDGNRAVAELAVFDGHLYASTLNPFEGFQLWKTRAEGPPPYRWKRVLSAGAYRGYLNEAAMSMCAFGDALYIGTCIAGGGYNRYHNIGPAAGEVIRVYPDDTWDLVVGIPRLTPDGVKLPLSGLGPGFNFPLNGYIWQICGHDDSLYIGTFNATSYFPFLPIVIPEEYMDLLDIKDNYDFNERFGGCHLWRSHDGEHFTPITTDGFGTPYNYGIRQLRSTPLGLVAGTANPFGPEVGVRRNGEWSYEPNPRGGLEIWVGNREYGGERLEVARVRKTAVTNHRETMAQISQMLMGIVQARLTADFYDQSGFTQMGYWRPGTLSAREACEELIARLLQQVPHTRGRILEVECGQGATTEALSNYYTEDQITAVDLLQVNLDAARRRVPGACFKQMSATRLEFDSGSFDVVICVEKAWQFSTRRAFLEEAYRVLAPGGRLLLSDILYSRTGDALCIHRHRQNHLGGPRAYKRLLEAKGFKDVKITDATVECADAHTANLTRYLRRALRNHEIDQGSFNTLFAATSLHVLFLRYYLLACGVKV